MTASKIPEQELRERISRMLDDALASSSSHPPGSAPEGFGGVIRADAEVTAILCRHYLRCTYKVPLDLDRRERLNSLLTEAADLVWEISGVSKVPESPVAFLAEFEDKIDAAQPGAL